MTKCFCYLRVSGASQIEGDGFDRQLLACQEYAAQNNLEIVEVFQEKGVSGTKELSNRPAFSALFAELKETGIRTILIEKLDRLARDVLVSETIVADILKNNYTLLSTCEPDLLSNDPSRKFIRVVLAAAAQLEKEFLVLKLKGARQRIKQFGRKVGAKNYSEKSSLNHKAEGRMPYGYKLGESDVLQEILSLSAQGNDVETITAILNSRGIPTRYGKQWRATSIVRIINRERNALVSA